MEETRTRSLVLPDVRGEERYLRVTWHPLTSTVVFSHWTGSVCTASTPVSLPQASQIIELLVSALRGLANETVSWRGSREPETSWLRGLLGRIRQEPTSIGELSRRVRDEWTRKVAR